jgi:hypothetical protein
VLATVAWASVAIGPLLVSAYLLIRRYVTTDGAGSAAGVLLLLTMLSISVPLAASSAAAINAFSGIGRLGYGAVQPVIEGVRTTTSPVFFGMLATTFALSLIARESFRVHHSSAPVSELRHRSALSLVVLMVGVLAGMHLLLELHHRVMTYLADVLAPMPRPRTMKENVRLLAESEYMIFLFISAAVATVALVVLGAATWRALRGHRQPAWFRQVSRAVAVIALAGTVWHTTVAYRDLRALADLETKLTQLAGGPPELGRR